MGHVVDAARMCGFEVYHPWLSVRSPRGWPDLALCKPPRLILAELKTAKGRTSADQDKWLSLLGACPGVETYLWRPADWDHIVRILRGPA